MLRELSFSDVSWSLSVSMYICVSGIFCVTECNESSDINNNKHATTSNVTGKFRMPFRIKNQNVGSGHCCPETPPHPIRFVSQFFLLWCLTSPRCKIVDLPLTVLQASSHSVYMYFVF